MPQGSLGEAVSTRIEMCLIDAQGQGLSVPVRCKDFLTDAYYSEYVKKPVGIWGFNWTPGKLNLKDPFRMAVRAKSWALGPKHADVVHSVVNPFSEALGYGSITTGSDGTSLWLFAPNPWTTKPALISALTMLVRTAFASKTPVTSVMPFLREVARHDNPECHGDGRWIQGTLEPLELMLKGKLHPKISKGFLDYPSSGEVHHGGGIYAAWTGKHTG